MRHRMIPMNPTVGWADDFLFLVDLLTPTEPGPGGWNWFGGSHKAGIFNATCSITQERKLRYSTCSFQAMHL